MCISDSLWAARPLDGRGAVPLLQLQPYVRDESGPLRSPALKDQMILRQEAADVLRRELHPDMRPKCIQTAGDKIVVEIPQHGRERDRLDPDLVGCLLYTSRCV